MRFLARYPHLILLLYAIPIVVTLVLLETDLIPLGGTTPILISAVLLGAVSPAVPALMEQYWKEDRAELTTGLEAIGQRFGSGMLFGLLLGVPATILFAGDVLVDFAQEQSTLFGIGLVCGGLLVVGVVAPLPHFFLVSSHYETGPTLALRTAMTRYFIDRPLNLLVAIYMTGYLFILASALIAGLLGPVLDLLQVPREPVDILWIHLVAVLALLVVPILLITVHHGTVQGDLIQIREATAVHWHHNPFSDE